MFPQLPAAVRVFLCTRPTDMRKDGKGRRPSDRVRVSFDQRGIRKHGVNREKVKGQTQP